MKLCKFCGETKPLTEFHKDRSTTDGLYPKCKPCSLAAHKEYVKRPARFICPEGMSRCSRCKEIKPLDQFYRNKVRYNGRSIYCAICQKAAHKQSAPTKEQTAAWMKNWRLNNLEKSKDYGRKTKYGVPIGWYADQLAKQGGKCAICKSEKSGNNKDFSVDHCHDTGIVRGLLCHNCNLGIGHFGHNSVKLKSAILYLTEGLREG